MFLVTGIAIGLDAGCIEVEIVVEVVVAGIGTLALIGTDTGVIAVVGI